MSRSVKQLYFDGSCPLCRMEMTHLENMKSPDLELVDIRLASLPEGKCAEDLLSLLHYRDANGQWVTGLDATAAAWSHTRLFWLFRILRWPLIGPVADRVYNLWARRRYQSRYCQNAN